MELRRFDVFLCSVDLFSEALLCATELALLQDLFAPAVIARPDGGKMMEVMEVTRG